MTREEEIMKVARVYANGIAQHSLNKKYCEEDFIAGAEWADAHPHWISVKDELPKLIVNKLLFDYSDDVLVYLKDGSITVGRWERDNSTGEQYWLLDIEKDLIVTHWMPLPSVEHLKKGGEE